jgi:hypothetical protein
MFFSKKPEDYDNKIDELKNAMKDELFLADLREVSEDFETVTQRNGGNNWLDTMNN